MKNIVLILNQLTDESSSSVERLRSRLSPLENLIVIEVNENPMHTLSMINKIIEDTKPITIIGHGVGGLYALACDSGKTPVYLINPILNPTNSNTDFARVLDTESEVLEQLELKRPYLAAIVSKRESIQGSSIYRLLTGNVNWLFTTNQFGFDFDNNVVSHILEMICTIEED